MPDVKRGLVGVVADTTTVSQVNPETNSLLYRGYPVQELAAFEAEERAARALPDAIRTLLDGLPTDAHPMDVVRTAVSVLGATDPTAEDASPEAERAKALRLFAVLPAIIAYDQRRRHGDDLVPPRDDLDYARNFLWMTFGEEPGDVEADVFRISMVLYAEHSFNASTFTARVITSTLADLHSAVVGAIGALKGALHGGANEAVLHMFDEIASAEAVDEWLDTALAEKRKIMGFGHRVYKHGDSRVPTMKTALDWLVAKREAHGLAELYDRLEAGMRERKAILPNLDYPSGPAYALLGFDTWMFTPLFVASRVTGWTAHVMEQRAQNALIRPLSEYVGHEERHVPGAPAGLPAQR